MEEQLKKFADEIEFWMESLYNKERSPKSKVTEWFFIHRHMELKYPEVKEYLFGKET